VRWRGFPDAVSHPARRALVVRVIGGSVVVDFPAAPRALRGGAPRDVERGARALDALPFSLDHVSSSRSPSRAGRGSRSAMVGRKPPRAHLALFIFVAGWRLGRRTIETLTDRLRRSRSQDHRNRALVPSVVAVEPFACFRRSESIFVDPLVAWSRTLARDASPRSQDRIESCGARQVPQAELSVTT